MKTLIIYYSHTGNNEALANELRRRLDCELLKVVERRRRTNLTILLDLIFRRTPPIKPPDRDLTGYDRLILIAPIWAGRIATPLVAFIAREKERFEHYAFITLCTGPDGQLEKITDELRRLSGKEPKAVMELKINDLLLPEQRNKIKYATNFRVKKEHFAVFEQDIERFLTAL